MSRITENAKGSRRIIFFKHRIAPEISLEGTGHAPYKPRRGGEHYHTASGRKDPASRGVECSGDHDTGRRVRLHFRGIDPEAVAIASRAISTFKGQRVLGWRSETRYLPLQDDIASVVYWYQSEPHATFPALVSRDDLEVI